MRTTARIVTLALLATASLAAWAQTEVGQTVASVNGDLIKAPEYFHKLIWYRADPRSPLVQLPAGFLALKDLITERLVFQMAKEKGAAPTDPEIDAEEKDEIAKDPNLLQDVQQSGRTEDDLKHDIAFQIAQYKLRTYGITITDQEVEQHYNQYPSEYTIPKQYKLRVIVVQDDAAQSAVDADLAAGKSFPDVASAHSVDISKNSGGEFGLISTAQLGTPAAQALENVKIGGTSTWVRGGQADSVRVKYMVEDITPPKLIPLDADLKKQIRKKLSLDKGDVKNQVAADLDAETMKAKIVITNAAFQRLYDQMLKQYSTARKAGG